MTEAIFACFDVETTRLDPSMGRVIEIAVVRIDDQGRPAGEWTTLVNPRTTDLGRTDIHGVQASWLTDAPNFLEIAGDLVNYLNGCVLVAHNAAFDRGFLSAEWQRAGLGQLDIPAIDTLALAKALGLPGRLSFLAEALDVPLKDAHTALGDSQALARVLMELIERSDRLPSVACFYPPLLAPPASGRVALRPILNT